jgi:hypothetical protein
VASGRFKLLSVVPWVGTPMAADNAAAVLRNCLRSIGEPRTVIITERDFVGGPWTGEHCENRVGQPVAPSSAHELGSPRIANNGSHDHPSEPGPRYQRSTSANGDRGDRKAPPGEPAFPARQCVIRQRGQSWRDFRQQSTVYKQLTAGFRLASAFPTSWRRACRAGIN